MMKAIYEKIKNFEKTKLEMTRHVINKGISLYKNTYNRKKDPRFKKYGGFKSMSRLYIENLFKDELIAGCF